MSLKKVAIGRVVAKETTSSGQDTTPYSQSKKCGKPGTRFPPFFRAKSRKILKILQRLGSQKNFRKVLKQFKKKYRKITVRPKKRSSLKFGCKNLKMYSKSRKNTPEIWKNTIGKKITKLNKKLKIWKNTLKIQKNTNENFKKWSSLNFG